jgi:hypothetical protein
MFENCKYFPLSQHLYYYGKKRWNEPYNVEEQVGYCGPPDRCCIDCYLCLIPVGFIMDIVTLNTFQCKLITNEN